MTEYFRIEGKNLIDFDRFSVAGTIPIYLLNKAVPPGDMSKPLTRQEIVSMLPRLPLGIRGHALNRGMSQITFPFSIQPDIEAGQGDREMEQALHDLKETLNEGQLHIESEDARGTQAVLHYKSDNAVQHSYKTLYYGFFEERTARDVLGARAKEHYLAGLQLTLYMEPLWRPASAVPLGQNEIYCPGLEEDGNADGLADNWVILNAPTLTMESTLVLQGFYSQKIVTGAFISRGIQSATFVAPAGTTSAVCYAWLCRPAAGSNIIVELYDVTTPAVVASALYDTAGWQTETAKDGTSIFKRVVVSSAAGIVAGRTYRMRIYNTVDTGATYYVDKCFWKWGTATAPDEWCDHWLIYNHYDTTEAGAHVGHQNYFDVADLKGTDESRLGLQVQFSEEADWDQAADLLIARRSWWERPSPIAARVRDVHWFEAEDASLVSFAAAALAACSAGGYVWNAAAIGGSAQFILDEIPLGAGEYGIDCVTGRYDVFAVVYTNDKVNTQYRLYYTNFGATIWRFNQWTKQRHPSRWEIIYLGEANLEAFIKSGRDRGPAYFTVEYAKDAADTVRLDCVWLLSKTEPQTRLHICAENGEWIEELHSWVFDRTEEFDYEAEERVNPGLATSILAAKTVLLHGDKMTLTPNSVVGQRLYFSAETVDDGNWPPDARRVWEAHGAATNLQMTIIMAYLPQYQTPLD